MWKLPKIKHGKPTKYGWTVLYPETFFLGEFTDIGHGCFIQAAAGVYIQDNVQIGGGTYIYSVSSIDGKSGAVIIEEGACIGARSLLLPGVTIGRGAVIGAMSLVNSDVPANETWLGVPARRKYKP